MHNVPKSIRQLKYLRPNHESGEKCSSFKKIIFTDKDFGQKLGFKMMNLAYINPESSFSLHYHEDMHELFYILSGFGIMKIGDKEYPVSKGNFVSVQPNKPHAIFNSGKRKMFYMVIGLAGEKKGKTVICEKI